MHIFLFWMRAFSWLQKIDILHVYLIQISLANKIIKVSTGMWNLDITLVAREFR